MLRDLVLRLRALLKPTAVDREIDDELRFHIDKQVESYEAAGLDRDEALRRARLEFGGLDQVKEDYRDALGVRIIDNLSRDLRLGVRSLRATPVVSAVAILSLALGMGANTAIFSIVNSLLLRTLPVEQPERLAILTGENGAWTNPIWEDIRGRSDLFDGAFAWSPSTFNIAQGGEAQMINGIWASGSFFDVLGVRPIIGRAMNVGDDRRGGGPDGAVAVISHSFWQRQFAGAADVVGRRITLNRVEYTVVGVAPPGFFGPDVGRAFDVVIPIGTEPLMRGKETWLDNRLTWWLQIMVRTKPAQTIDAAQAVWAGVTPQIREATLPPNRSSDQYLTGPITLAAAATGRSTLRVRYERALYTMLIVVALVLLIACANIANLLLARATARRHELSVRLALGAGQWRLAQQLLVESFVLALAGAALGLLFAQWAAPLLVAQLSTPAAATVFLDLALDWRVLGFTTALTVLTALVFGTVPALRASRVTPMVSIKEGGRTLTGEGRHSVASGLVVAQVGLSLVLVVVAGLFVRTFVSLATLPLGLEAERVLLVTISAPQSRFGETDLGPLYARVGTTVSAVPGVAQAALSRIQPVTGGGGWRMPPSVEGAPPLPQADRGTWMNAVTPQWFATLGIPLLAGRDFTDNDREGSPLVAIVNEAFARQFSVGPNPVGRVILAKQSRDTAQGEEEWDVRIEIVGLCADAVYSRLREPMPPTMFVPLPQEPPAPSTITLSVRAAAGSPALLAKSVGSAIAGVNPDLVLTFQPLRDRVDFTLSQERMLAMLSGFFGATALLLAGLGLYGVTSYAVSRRRNEIGIRMALGAKPSGVIRLVLTRVFTLVSLGVVIGGIASVWASRYVATLLFGLEPNDLATLAGSAALLAGVAALAGWLPARRAARIDPATVLRES